MGTNRVMKMIEATKFRNKITGEIATVIPLLDINNWEKVEGD